MSDPIAWLERNLDADTAGQDVASIRGRLAALETILGAANAIDPETHWDADSEPGQARCQRCRQPVEAVIWGRDRYEPERVVLTVFPCGHHDGYSRGDGRRLV